ncbi:MAG: transposase [Lamprobacter sp.]|uniref:IS1634 family transposase n=1 Tax=Lamprobacter sp. TaxID=3100796 RepID=UPI002B25C14C|nr:transposase [Lamprobacter sp.]MEA3640983.1 transposase [Lamprobacter sp.]
MYIRRTQTRNTATGERYFTHRLVRSERQGGKVRQVTLLNLGRHFPVAQADWPTLCVRLEEILSGQEVLLGGWGGLLLEREAQRLAALLLARQGAAPAATVTASTAPVEVHSIVLDSLKLSRARTVGVEAVGLWAMAQVDFVEQLETLGLTGPQRAAVLGVILGRMAAPGSELATQRWLCQRSGLGELLDVDFEAMSLMQLYRAADVLMRHREPLERALFARLTGLFGLDWSVTLDDLTNTYFEGEAAANPKAQHGHSKEKRSDCPLLTLGLVLDGSGFVRRSEVFDGNVVEGTTLAGMLQRLRAPKGALVVMDRGIATGENLLWLREQGYRYRVVSRERHRQFDPSDAHDLKTARGERVSVQRVEDAEAGEVRLSCYSERRAGKEQGISQRFAERFEAALQAMADGLARPRTTKQIDKLWERIGRLKEKSHGAGQHDHIELIPDASGEQAQAIRWQRRPIDGTMETHPGVYCLRSNELTWDAEQLWRTYIMLTDLEIYQPCCLRRTVRRVGRRMRRRWIRSVSPSGEGLGAASAGVQVRRHRPRLATAGDRHAGPDGLATSLCATS